MLPKIKSTSGRAIAFTSAGTVIPSRLILGWHENLAIHVVAAYDEQTQTDIIITVYKPDPSQWETGFKRKKPS